MAKIKKLCNIVFAKFSNIDNYLYNNFPIYINLNVWSCIKLYAKVFKVFITPDIVVHKFGPNENEFWLGSDYFYTPKETDKLLYIDCIELGYKSRYSDLEFENVPTIVIGWNKHIRYIIGFECPFVEPSFDIQDLSKLTYNRDNHKYWESILYYLYRCNKDIYKTYKNNIWTRPVFASGEKVQIIGNIPLTCFNLLRSKYKQLVINEIYKAKNNDK